MSKSYSFEFSGTKEMFLNQLNKYNNNNQRFFYFDDYIIELSDDDIRFGVARGGHSGGYWFVPTITELDGKTIFCGTIEYSDAYSAVYICDIEKDRRPVPDDILEKLPALLHLTEAETEEMYDLAARSRNTVSADLPEYIMEKDIVRAALRTAKKHNVTDKQWEDFIRRITKESD